LVRNSSLTGTDFQPEARSAPRVVGRDAGTSGFVIDATVPRWVLYAFRELEK
jgi:hypothetical protein